MMKDFGLVAVTFFGLIVAVFVAAGLVHKEVEKRTVFVLFSKPVSRAAFIAGKFIGLCGTMAVVLGRDGRVPVRAGVGWWPATLRAWSSSPCS